MINVMFTSLLLFSAGAVLSSANNNVAERILSWMDNSSDPCKDFHQYACGNVLEHPPFTLKLSISQKLLPPGPLNLFEYPIAVQVRQAELQNQMRKILTQGTEISEAIDCCKKLLEIDLFRDKAVEAIYMSAFERISEISRNVSSSRELFWKSTVSGIPIQFIERLKYDYAEYQFSFDDYVKLKFPGISRLPEFESLVNVHEKHFAFLNTSISTHQNAYRLLKDIYSLQGISTGQVIVYPSSVNLTSQYDRDGEWLSVLLDPYDKVDTDVYTDSVFLENMKKIDQLMNLYDFKSIQVFFLYLVYENPLEFLNESTLCSNLSTLYPNELRKLLYDQEADKEAFKISHFIKKSIIEGIKSSTWMDQQTRNEALEKALRMGTLIQMPDFDFPTKKMQGCSVQEFFENYLQRNFAIDSSIWAFYPLNRVHWNLQDHFYYVYGTAFPAYSDINAAFDQESNSFKINYGIMGSPFFEKDAPDAVNFGAIGSVIAHEISHGYDSLGRQYDSLGTKRNWWSNFSLENFEEKCSCFVEQYSHIPINGTYFDGQYTLIENIADNAGIQLAWSAFKSYEHYFGKDDSDLIGGISNDQLFFLSYAQKSCVPLSFISLIDTHSPAQARISGTLMNLPEFAKAFNCPTGSKLNPEKKCSLWGSPLSSIQ